MSKIKKLTTRLNDSIVFAPKLVLTRSQSKIEDDIEMKEEITNMPLFETKEDDVEMKEENTNIPLFETTKDEYKIYIEHINNTLKEDYENISFNDYIERGEYILFLIIDTIDTYCDNCSVEDKGKIFNSITHENRGLIANSEDELDELFLRVHVGVEEHEQNKKGLIEGNFSISQLLKMYEKIVSDNPYLKKYNKNIKKNKRVKGTLFSYFKFIVNKPLIALCTLLWFDSFHDFKNDRIKEKSEDEAESKGGYNLNNIVKKLTGKNIDEYYRDSFFEYNQQGHLVGFNINIRHTVLRPLITLDEINKKYFSEILYNLSSIFIEQKKFESDFLHSYIMYMFKFNFIEENGSFNQNYLLNELDKISFTSIDSKSVPYWCKDVDEDSANFLLGTKVILPSSIFDQNKSNSSNNPKKFVELKSTIIPHANGYYFTYEFNKECLLTVKYGGNEILKMKDSKSSCTSLINTDIESIDIAIRDLHNSIKKNNKPNITKGYEDIVSKKIMFNTNPVNLKSQPGFSPKLITMQIIILLCKGKNLSCAELDFWFSLKRIGDYGQILQAKQLGIPLFTNDKMQILLCLATRTNCIFSIDGTKANWYNGKEDIFVKNTPQYRDGISRRIVYDIDYYLVELNLETNYENQLRETSTYIKEEEKKNILQAIDVEYFKDNCGRIFIDYINGASYTFEGSQADKNSSTENLFPHSVYNKNMGDITSNILHLYHVIINNEGFYFSIICSSIKLETIKRIIGEFLDSIDSNYLINPYPKFKYYSCEEESIRFPIFIKPIINNKKKEILYTPGLTTEKQQILNLIR